MGTASSQALKRLRVALVYDWVVGLRGGERVLDEIAGLFPKADLYTLIHRPGSTTERIDSRTIYTSPLQRIPGINQHYRKFLPFFPSAIEHFNLPPYNLVISISHCVAKGIRTQPETPHLCYCFTPMRYIWDQVDQYLGHGMKRHVAKPLIQYLRRWDVKASQEDRIQQFVAISQTSAKRIKQHYGREASVVYPPVNTESFQPSPTKEGDYYLMVSSFVPYKRDDLALAAFEQLGRRLLIAGDGPRRKVLQQKASEKIEFLGRVSDERLRSLYANARALIYPQEEDFGIIPVEAQACGCPVIAYAAGGASETVIDLNSNPIEQATGFLFPAQNADSLINAIHQFELHESKLLAHVARAQAQRFSTEHFRRNFQKSVDALLQQTTHLSTRR